jgi:prepilin-type N-terminal cleavage/methylation domain-containing protein
MIGALRRGHRDDRGFTLVELLVVVTILGILAAVVTSSLLGLTNTAATNACKEEKSTVQVAMDAMMAAKNITTVTAQASATNAFSALPAGTGADPLYPSYIRSSTTHGTYTWTTGGEITQVACT